MSGTSYETLASTRLLATHCAVCGRPLRDALSVEVAIGPDCRAKYGYDQVEVTPEGRAEANALIYQLADARWGARPELLAACSRLLELGFKRLAARIFERFVKVVVQLVDGQITVKVGRPLAPSHATALSAIPGRRYDPEEHLSLFPYSTKDQVWAALRRLYGGERALLPNGKVVEIKPIPSPDGFGDVSY